MAILIFGDFASEVCFLQASVLMEPSGWLEAQ